MVGLAKMIALVFLALTALAAVIFGGLMGVAMAEGKMANALATLPIFAGLAFFAMQCAFVAGVLELLEKQNETLSAIRRGQGQTAKAVRDLGADSEEEERPTRRKSIKRKSRGGGALKRALG